MDTNNVYKKVQKEKDEIGKKKAAAYVELFRIEADMKKDPIGLDSNLLNDPQQKKWAERTIVLKKVFQDLDQKEGILSDVLRLLKHYQMLEDAGTHEDILYRF